MMLTSSSLFAFMACMGKFYLYQIILMTLFCMFKTNVTCQMCNSKSSLLTRYQSSCMSIMKKLAKQSNWSYWMSSLSTAIKSPQVSEVPTWPWAWAEAQVVWMHLRGTHETDAVLNCLLILWWFIMESKTFVCLCCRNSCV